eukprot:3319108-Rhodomonas_salina.1
MMCAGEGDASGLQGQGHPRPCPRSQFSFQNPDDPWRMEASNAPGLFPDLTASDNCLRLL